jgi:putative transposase
MKAVVQKHHASPNLLDLLNEFRRMVNICIAAGMEENISSFKTLSLKSYHRLSPKILSYYRLYAISAATGMLHNHRKAKKRNARATMR